jgi:hypothetical protein
MFTKIRISGLGPTSDLSGGQPTQDISVSGEPSQIGDVVSAGDTPSINPQAAPQPGGFGRLSVEQAVAAIDARAKRISIVRPRI